MGLHCCRNKPQDRLLVAFYSSFGGINRPIALGKVHGAPRCQARGSQEAATTETWASLPACQLCAIVAPVSESGKRPPSGFNLCREQYLQRSAALQSRDGSSKRRQKLSRAASNHAKRQLPALLSNDNPWLHKEFLNIPLLYLKQAENRKHNCCLP